MNAFSLGLVPDKDNVILPLHHDVLINVGERTQPRPQITLGAHAGSIGFLW